MRGSKTWKDQRKHRLKVSGSEEGFQEHLKRDARRGVKRKARRTEQTQETIIRNRGQELRWDHDERR